MAQLKPRSGVQGPAIVMVIKPAPVSVERTGSCDA